MRSAPEGAFLRGFPSVSEGCAGLQRRTYHARIFRSVSAAVGGIGRLSPLWFLVPLLLPPAKPPVSANTASDQHWLRCTRTR